MFASIWTPRDHNIKPTTNNTPWPQHETHTTTTDTNISKRFPMGLGQMFDGCWSILILFVFACLRLFVFAWTSLRLFVFACLLFLLIFGSSFVHTWPQIGPNSIQKWILLACLLTPFGHTQPKKKKHTHTHNQQSHNSKTLAWRSARSRLNKY